MGETVEREASAKIQRLEGFLRVDPDNPVLLQDLALVCHRSGKQDQALDACARWEKLQPESPALLNLKGSIHLARGEWDKAAVLFTEAVARDTRQAALRFNLGYAQMA